MSSKRRKPCDSEHATQSQRNTVTVTTSSSTSSSLQKSSTLRRGKIPAGVDQTPGPERSEQCSCCARSLRVPAFVAACYRPLLWWVLCGVQASVSSHPPGKMNRLLQASKHCRRTYARTWPCRTPPQQQSSLSRTPYVHAKSGSSKQVRTWGDTARIGICSPVHELKQVSTVELRASCFAHTHTPTRKPSGHLRVGKLNCNLHPGIR